MIERAHPRLVRLVMCMAIFVKRPSRLKVLRQPVPIARGGMITSDMKFAMEFAVPRKLCMTGVDGGRQRLT